jgi:hypothetical protein
MDDELFLSRAIGRIQTSIAVLSGAGAIAAFLYGGWRWAVGFALGAGASWVNFRWLKQLANSLGEAMTGKRPKVRVAVFLGLRYLLLAAAGYVILNFTALSLAAGFVGLLVPVAAAILEILFELVYAGT